MRQLYFFHVPWCPPCRFFEEELIAPLRTLAAHEQIISIDVQREPLRADRYGVRRVPMAILVEDGKAVDYVGLGDKDRCADFLQGRPLL